MKKFLDDDGLTYLMGQIKAMIDQAKQVDLITTIDEDSTNQQIPGAKAVYDLLTAALEGITSVRMEVVDALPATGESNVIYLLEVDEDTYSLHIYSGGQWYDTGTTEINLSDYWAKEDLVALTNTEIQEIIDNVMEG
jgi:hypothetical protein